MILGIETSCDETAAAVVTETGSILSSIVSSQAALHAPYGGVVPEIASRRKSYPSASAFPITRPPFGPTRRTL